MNEIFSDRFAINKYSKSYNNLRIVIDLESTDKQKISKELSDEFKTLSKKYNDFIDGVPLRIIELYFYNNIKDMSFYPYIEYKNDITIDSVKVIELYELLENFFDDVFSLSSKIANYYNMEMKLNVANDEDYF